MKAALGIPRRIAAMTLDIPSEFENVLNDAVASGAFETPQDALRHALALLANQQHEDADAKGHASRSGTNQMPHQVDVDELARQQGVEPFSLNDPRRADIWPSDESVDDFIASIRAQRDSDDSQPESFR